MHKVFISYSRKDKEFVKHLTDALVPYYDIWIDFEDIPLASDWWAEVRRGIEQAECFISIITPNYLASVICKDEVEYAASLNKRLLPVMREECKGVFPKLAALNWIFFLETNDFDASVRSLRSALATDLEDAREHTRIFNLALEWQHRGKDASYLLRGRELRDAQDWLMSSSDSEPVPLQLHREFIGKSTLQQRRLLEIRILFIGAAMAVIVYLVNWSINFRCLSG